MAAHNYQCFQLQVQEIRHPLLASVDTRHMCGTHTCVQAKKKFSEKLEIKYFKI